MPAYYALADVALLGGSFAPLGGQNLIEAAACGCPVVMGPHTFNFADAGGARRSPPARRCASARSTKASPSRVAELGSEALARQATAALGFAASHQGAAGAQRGAGRPCSLRRAAATAA